MEQKETAQPNSGRQFELDFAKFIAIICMILVHCYDYSPLYLSSGDITSEVHTTSVIGTVIEFLGAQPAAPVFMFCMGVGMVYTRHNSPGEFARRGVKLIVTGYLLNLYRTLFVVGGGMAGIVGQQELYPLISAFALCVDILPFAGLSFLFFALMERLRISHAAATVIVLALLIIAGILPKAGDGEEWYCYVAGLLWYQNSFTSFPLMQWLPFPMAGVLFGSILKKTEDKKRFYLLISAAGIVTFAVTTLIALYQNTDLLTFFTTDYFDMNLLRTAWSLGIVMILLPLYYLMTRNISGGYLYNMATFCSRNINKIYLWQWILITPISALSLSVLPIDTYWKLAIEATFVFIACILVVGRSCRK